MKQVAMFGAAAALLLGSASPPQPVSAEVSASPPLLQAAALPWPDGLSVPPPPPPPPPIVPEEGVRVVVSIPQQQAWVFDDGELVDTVAVSTGRKGYETPAGTFPILQKKVHHRSNLYANAPMPYMQRLTWSGVALHAGYVPGRPASHGCIRLPRSFAKTLYGMTNFETTVTVTHQEPESAEEALALIPTTLV